MTAQEMEETPVRNRVFTLLVIALLLIGVAPMAFAAPPVVSSSQADPDPQYVKNDDRPDPLSLAQRDTRQKGLEAKLNGKAYGKTHAVARGQYVELEREGEDPVWTVLGEFSDMSHNEMPEPDRSVDNTNIWTADFSRDYYLDLLFAEGRGLNSMRNYYIEQSSNRYTVHGDVTDWVPVPGVAASYDDDFESPLGGNQVWYFLIDTLNGWYDAQIAAGKTPAEIDEYLSGFDVWDRYDWDGDGNFDEPDGYIDHMQFVHAGPGNESCSPACDDWAIWSHSWFAFFNLVGTAGPSPAFLEGGIQIGDSSYWVNKYTIQPENGGVGVFAHEYGHDLGLPDLYDTSGGENSTGFWTLMSSGSNLGGDNPDIGSKPSHMGAWEKLQLGWLNYEVAFAGTKSEHKLGPMETNTKQAQGLFVILPKKEVVSYIGAPFAGDYYYYSGAGDYLDNFMYKPFDLPAGATLTAKVKYSIELDWDYAYLIASTDGGVTWTYLPTNLSTNTNPNGQNFGNGITGSSEGAWVDLTADLSALSGEVLLGFRYWTDPNTGGFGFMVDNIDITDSPTDGAEADAGWTFDGFKVTNGTEAALFNHYYVAEFRQYYEYDSALQYAYNFGFLDNPQLGDFVEHFPYQGGLLINYWDTSQKNNQVRLHPGQGLLLTVDAHPTAMIRADGGVWRNRMQSYDSTFSLQPTEAITLHWLSQPSYHPSQPAVPVFDDRNSYYDPLNPWGSVIVPNTGTQIRIQSVSAQGGFMQVQVRPAK
jgi:immune inhibitor A